jgi:hypothetical protein
MIVDNAISPIVAGVDLGPYDDMKPDEQESNLLHHGFRETQRHPHKHSLFFHTIDFNRRESGGHQYESCSFLPADILQPFAQSWA